jgi:acyl-CoA synthetase (AMP-forming)/AMP-acid ligase II
MDHIGGLNTLFHVLSDGGTLITIEQRTAQAAAAAIERHKVELLPATPTFLRMLLISGALDDHDLSSLELISYGTEPMPHGTLESLNRAFPGVRLKQTYGLSEMGIMPTSSLDSHSLWMKVGGAGCETRVQGGTLWVRSPTAMIGYLNAPPPFDADGWYDTGDAVEMNGEYLRIVGRKSEMINVGGEKVYPAEVENVLLQMDNIADATVTGKSNPLTGHVVVATVRLRAPEEKRQLEQRLYAFCRERMAAYKIPVLLEISEDEQHNARFKKVRTSDPGTAAESWCVR